MLAFLFSFVLATAAGVTTFLVLFTGNMKYFKSCLFRRRPLPFLMPDGNIVNSKDDLDFHLGVLEKNLLEKTIELESSKSKVKTTKESIDRLADSQLQVKKYYMQLKQEIQRSEDKFKKLQEQIDDYRFKRVELEEDMKKNELYYNNLLSSVKKGRANTSQISLASTTSQHTIEVPHERQTIEEKIARYQPARQENSRTLIDFSKDTVFCNSASPPKSSPIVAIAKVAPYVNPFKKCESVSEDGFKTRCDINNNTSKAMASINKTPTCMSSLQEIPCIKPLKDKFAAQINSSYCGAKPCTEPYVFKTDIQSLSQAFHSKAILDNEKVTSDKINKIDLEARKQFISKQQQRF